MKKLLSTLIALLLLVVAVQAQSVDDLLKPVTRTYALKNVTIVQKPGQVIENGTIIIKNGLIQAVGKNVTIPGNAKVLEADSMYVYAGFIDALSNVGIPAPKPDTDRSRPRGEIRENPPYEMAGIMPHAKAVDQLSAKDKEIEGIRKLGFTAVNTVPHGGMIPGQTAVIVLAGEEASDMIVLEDLAMVGTLQSARGVYPSTIMGVMSKYRELFEQTHQLMHHWDVYKKNPAMVRPESDDGLEALMGVASGKQMMLMVAPEVLDLYRAMTLEKDMKVDMIMANVKEGWRVLDELKAAGEPIIVSTDLPKELKEEKKDGEKAEEKEEKEMDPEVEALKKRQKEVYEQYVGQAATLAKAGITFAFSTMGTKSGDLRGNLGRMIKAGLDKDVALAALTTTPAEMLGVSKVMGTVEKGKIANLVVSDKPYFEEKSNVRFVIIDGQVFEYEVPKKRPAGGKGGPAGAGSSAAAINGNWTFTVDVPGQAVSGTMDISNAGGDISGKMNSEGMGETSMDNIELDGSTMLFSTKVEVQGQSMTLEYEITFSGAAFEGSVSVGSFGTFDVTGAKKPN